MNENETEVVVDDDNYDVDLSEFEDLPEEDGEGNQTEPEQQEDSQAQETTEGEEEQSTEEAAADEQA